MKEGRDEIKPRKWLITIIIIISILIAGFLAYKAVIGVKGLIDKEIKREEAQKKEYEEKQKQRIDEINRQKQEQEQKLKEQQKKFAADRFNSSLELRKGSQVSFSLKYLIDDIVTSNKKNPDKLITVVFESTTTTNPEEIQNLKNKLEEWHYYEVSLDYDSDGYVNRIKISY